MLETLFYYGLRLFSYRDYVGSVLHVYNVLRQCTNLEPIPLLEELCGLFNGILFPGGSRPKKNFVAEFVRYKGGRLRIRKNSKDHRSGNHHMLIPPHTARSTAGFSGSGVYKGEGDGRFEYKKVCLFHHVKEKGYHLDNGLWRKVQDLAKGLERIGDSGNEKDGKGLSCTHHNHQETSLLSSLLTAILPSFTKSLDTPLPIGTINLFAVYLSCVRIVSIISDRCHDDKDKGLNCLCFVDVLLKAEDRYRENVYKMQPFGCGELVKIVGEAMREVLGAGFREGEGEAEGLGENGLQGFAWRGI